MPDTSIRRRLASALHEYRGRWPDEAGCVAHFLELLQAPGDPWVRERREGHLTASSLLVSADGRRTLLTHHRKLGLWLQPGGHADGDRDLGRVALREAQEETGLPGLVLEPEVFDLDRHWIPAHDGVPAHWHYDVRHVVRAGAQERFTVSPESHALAWRDIAGVAGSADMDASLRRMARKWLARAAASA